MCIRSETLSQQKVFPEFVVTGDHRGMVDRGNLVTANDWFHKDNSLGQVTHNYCHKSRGKRRQFQSEAKVGGINHLRGAPAYALGSRGDN
eukprot:jgi/Botrbrau1/20999/Bobra.0144s0017.1